MLCLKINRILKMVWILWILKWTWFVSIFPVEGIGDTKCYNNCNCCKNYQCHASYGFENACAYGCIDRHRGGRCYELCTYDCVSCTNRVDICTECHEGFYLGPNQDCTSECPSTCRSCSSNTRCTTCKEGYYNQGGSTTCPYSLCPENCKCNGDTCVACKNGFFDTTSSCAKTCPPNCMTCSSTEQCNKCENGYYNGYNLDSNTGPLFRNCTLKCRETCHECQSYDICLQCISGRYDNMCHSNCSVGCKDGTCDFESGECACSSDFVGNKCTECVHGKHGTYCNKTCPLYCKNGKCSKVVGHCSDGCIIDTIIGETCNICRNGTRGELCNKPCPGNCKGTNCDRYTGICSEGCKGNFIGDLCKACLLGKYGANCQEDCSAKCANSICVKDTGKCLNCTGNFDGDNCNACNAGFYGMNCREACSPQCLNRTCGIHSGICNHGCRNNYSGDKCCVQNNNCIECASNTECNKCKSGYFGNLCEDSCPVTCLDTCDISTGICRDCIINHFGPFCNLKCSNNCNASRSSSSRNCASSDGTCLFGCKGVFFGLTCNETCSSLCIDGRCTQKNGQCVLGCTGSYGNPECALSVGQAQDVYDKSSTMTIIAVLATFLVLTTTVLCVIITKKIVKKIHVRLTDRQTEKSGVHMHFKNSLVQNGDEIAACGEDNVAYEVIDLAQVPEQEYDAANPSAPNSPVIAGNIDYVNLQL